MKLLVSVSGGATSGYLAYKIKHSQELKYLFSEIHYVFFNTGSEHPKTYEFLKTLDKEFELNLHYLEAITNPEKGKGVSVKEVRFEELSRNNEPYYEMIKKHGIPNIKFPHCTREMKTYLSRAYARYLGWKKAVTAIGIRADEFDRRSTEEEDKLLIYPLIDVWPTTKEDVLAFWGSQSFKLDLEPYLGNCVFCFKKSIEKLIKVAREDPSYFDFPLQMEKEFSVSHRTGKEGITFFRGGLSAQDILNLSKLSDEEIKIRLKTKNLNFSQQSGCSESCEVY